MASQVSGVLKHPEHHARHATAPTGTVSRAVTAVKIFDYPKMDLTAGRLIAPGANAWLHRLIASSADFGTEYCLIDPQTVRFNPLTAS